MKGAVTKVTDMLTQEDFHGAFQKLLEWFNKCYIVIYIIIQHHNDTISMTDAWINDARIKGAGMKDAGRKTQEDFFRKIFTSHFIARVRKGCSRFACERELETEHKLHILTPLLWLSRCVLFSWCWGPLHRGFPRVPSVGCGFPYHIWSLGVWVSTGNCSGTQTQLS